ncbi:hypothetical protein [Oceanobacter mangrovi]|uniref:hypothetical protein n=1 Tax=Oceanobacter mangrovi TaxID=2862510 RepID=UPI001C8DC3AE|nr:hypothetical protein [Oceanobacter mangrovi]
MAAVFKVSPDEQGLFQFEYFNGKGERLMVSQVFADQAATDQAIQEVRVGSMMSQFISKGQTPEGSFFFTIANQSGQTLVKSIPFENEMQFNNALHQVRDGACIASIAYD